MKSNIITGLVLFIPLDKCVYVCLTALKLRKKYVILLPLVYDLGKISRGHEMNEEIVYASLVRSTGFEQIYCRPNFSYMYLPRARSGKFLNNYHRQNGPSSLFLLNVFFALKGSYFFILIVCTKERLTRVSLHIN